MGVLRAMHSDVEITRKARISRPISWTTGTDTFVVVSSAGQQDLDDTLLVTVRSSLDALGAALGDRDLPYVSVATPPVPADPASGPAMLVAGRAAVYALDS